MTATWPHCAAGSTSLDASSGTWGQRAAMLSSSAASLAVSLRCVHVVSASARSSAFCSPSQPVSCSQSARSSLISLRRGRRAEDPS